MAPYKIYTDNRGSYAELPVFSQADANVEYLRKDALLEWAKEQATITEKLNGKGAMLKAWDSLIDKIESL